MTQPTLVLYDYWRSSASYRVRIALNLLGLQYERHKIDLLKAEHQTPEYLALNPQGLLPTLLIDGKPMTQSLAIIEYMHAITRGSSLLPIDPFEQQRVRQLAYAIAMDIHPICNLSVVKHVQTLTTDDAESVKVSWMRHHIEQGLSAFEKLLDNAEHGSFCHGNVPSLADCCLIPQLYNAQRWGVDYSGLQHIARIAGSAAQVQAFVDAQPEDG